MNSIGATRCALLDREAPTMSEADRKELLRLAAAVNPIYGAFARNSLAAGELIRFVEAYAKGARR